MKLVIDIDDEDYKRIQDIPDVFDSLTSRAYSAIRNGIPLPKGHGRIGDAVSRNAITRALNEMDRYVADELTLCNTDKKFPHNEVFIVDDVYEQIVEQLPSVIPQQKRGKWIDYSDEGYVECPFCGHATNCEDNIDGLHYCFYCGAKMESEG